MDMSSINNTKLLSILISLSSLEIHNRKYPISNIITGNKQLDFVIDHYNFQFYTSKNFPTVTLLSLIKYIYTSSLKKDIYKKICSILNYQATKYTSQNRDIHPITHKYIQRFLYQHKRYYKHNLNGKHYLNKVDILRLTSIKNLYILYRSVSQQNVYILFKYLQEL